MLVVRRIALPISAFPISTSGEMGMGPLVVMALSALSSCAATPVEEHDGEPPVADLGQEAVGPAGALDEPESLLETPLETPSAQYALDGGRQGPLEAETVVADEAQPHTSAPSPVADDLNPVPAGQVREVCGLDPDALRAADERLGRPWVAIRHGRLCHAYQADMARADAYSAAKFLGTVVAGAVAYRTAGLPSAGYGTGPFSDEDRVDHWLDDVPFNPDAHVAHVLGMVAQSQDLSPGERVMEYDYFGFVQLDSLNWILNTVLQQPGAELGADLEEFTTRYLFDPVGMTSSVWSFGFPNKSFGFGFETTVLDLARLGLLVLNGGTWQGRRLLSEEWTYRMTHPSFEDANTAMGYCTWLNSRAKFHSGTQPIPAGWEDFEAMPRYPGPCAPVSIYREHPHGLSTATDCNYGPRFRCEQDYDVGVWQSVAGFGTVIQGHPGLDLLLVGFQLTPDDFFAVRSSGVLWDAVRPAVVQADPLYSGDEAGFCEAYGGNRYAPDL